MKIGPICADVKHAGGSFWDVGSGKYGRYLVPYRHYDQARLQTPCRSYFAAAGHPGRLCPQPRPAARRPTPPRTFTQQTPGDFGITNWHDVTFTAEDGVQLSGWYVPPQSKPGAALIFVHGLGSNRGSLLDQAAVSAKEGYGALLLDLRAHGRSQGKQSSWGLAEVADVQAALHFLQAQPEVDPAKIGIVGHSMGGKNTFSSPSRITFHASRTPQSPEFSKSQI